MNNIFLFISYYSVVYVKFTYCLEVPENMPLHYFDGKDWVTVKPRNNEVKPEVSKPINITQLLDWEKLSRLLQPMKLETTPDTTTTTTTTTRKPTTKPTTAKKPTTKKPTGNKKPTAKPTTRTTKPTTRKPRSTQRRLKFMTKRTIPPSARCMYNLCNEKSTTMRHKKVYEIWKRVWKKTTAEANPTTLIPPLIPGWIIHQVTDKRVIEFPMTVTMNYLRSQKKITKTTKATTRTTKKATTLSTRKATTRTTTKPTTRTTTTRATTTPKPTTKQVTKPPGRSNMNMTEFPTLPKNWMELMKEFVKVFKSVNTTTMCERSSSKETTNAPLNFLLSDKRQKMTNVEDLINILNDGVQIDNGLIDDLIDARNQLRNTETVTDAELPLSENLVLEHNIASIKNDNYQLKNKYLYLKGSSLKGYFDKKRTAYEKEDDALSRDGEISAYINVFINRYLKTDSTTQPQQTTVKYNDLQALIDIIRGKISPEEVLRNTDKQRNVGIESLVENMAVQNAVTKKIFRANSDADSTQLLKKHRDHWKERDIRKHLNKIKEKYSEKQNEEQRQIISPTLDNAVVFTSNKTNPKTNADSQNDKKILGNEDIQSLFSNFVMFLLKNISADAQKVTKPIKETKEHKLDYKTLELILKLNKINPFLTKFPSKPTEDSQPLIKDIEIDNLPINYFSDKDEILNYNEEDDYYERYDTKGIEKGLTAGGLGIKDNYYNY